jgi:hypothetical protein
LNYITDVAYASFNILPNGNVIALDPIADTQRMFTPNKDSPYQGNLGEFRKLKQQFKFNLTLVLDGPDFSTNFDQAIKAQTRTKVVTNIANILNKYQIFNGIVIKWVNGASIVNFRIFCELLRQRFNSENKKHYTIEIFTDVYDPSLDPVIDSFFVYGDHNIFPIKKSYLCVTNKELESGEYKGYYITNLPESHSILENISKQNVTKWNPNNSYKKGDKVLFKEVYYTCNLTHDSSELWTPEYTNTILWSFNEFSLFE